MKKNFNIDDYKDSKDKQYVMHCKTKKQAETFCKYLNSVGRKWITGESYLSKTNWEVNKSKTGYDFNKGMYRNIDIITIYRDEYLKLGCYKWDYDHIVLEFDDFKW